MKKKIAIVGVWMVWTSFLYSAINKEIVGEYVLIDINEELTLWHKLDIEDSIPHTSKNITLSIWSYDDCYDADMVVITAWRAQKKWETRLNMISDNAKIMTFIANSIKKSWFAWISLIVSNPVDCLTTIYQKITWFDSKRVVSSWCVLDSSRLKVEIAKKLWNFSQEIEAYIIWEHGDSSVAVFSQVKVLWKLLNKDYFSQEEKEKIHTTVVNKAYEIIDRKWATYYGIWTVLADISESILYDKNKVFSVWILQNIESTTGPIYSAFPSTVWKEWAEKINHFPLTIKEENWFNNSKRLLNNLMKNM